MNKIEETEEIRVSVIVPVYNTAPYLETAVDSILSQSLAALEVIAVDDGSTDESPRILAEMAARDSRLHVYTQTNQGQSVARNTGLRHARGQFVYFFDSDDYLAPEALEECYRQATVQACDLLLFDASIMDDAHPQRTALLPYHRKGIVSAGVYTGAGLLKQLMDLGKYSASPCLCFIRSSFLHAAQLQFYPGIIHEDQLFTFLLILKAESVCLLPEPYFHRRLRANSTMTSAVSMRNINGYLTVCRELTCYLHREDTPTNHLPLVNRHITGLVNILASTSLSLPFSTRMKILRTLLTTYPRKVKIQSVLLLLLPCLKQKKKLP